MAEGQVVVSFSLLLFFAYFRIVFHYRLSLIAYYCDYLITKKKREIIIIIEKKIKETN